MPERKAAHLVHFQGLISEINRCMKIRGITPRKRGQLAREAGIGYSGLWNILRGHSAPSASTTTALAEALDWPRLQTISDSIRTKQCEICPKSFMDHTSTLKQRYCSKACRGTANTRARRASRGDERRILARRLEKHTEAVQAHCRWCEPAGICQDSECALRPVSPLPLPRGEQWEEVKRQQPWLLEKSA